MVGYEWQCSTTYGGTDKVPMTYIQKGTPVFRKITFAFFAAGFNTFAILYCVQPLMEEFTREFHVTPTAASLSLSLTTMLLAASMLVFGSLSEVWGRKPIMAVSMLAASVLCLASAFSPNFHTLLVLRTIQGLRSPVFLRLRWLISEKKLKPESLGRRWGCISAETQSVPFWEDRFRASERVLYLACSDGINWCD